MRNTTELRLRRAFAEVLGALASTSASAIVIAGCGMTTDPVDGVGGGGGGPQPAFTSLCQSGVKYTLLSGVKTSPPLDGAMQRSETAFLTDNTGGYGGGVVSSGDPEDGDLWKAQNYGLEGTMCATAKDGDACRAKVEGFRLLPPDRETCKAQYPATYSGCAVQYTIYTRGDEIGVARTRAETMALIGSVDTIEEALYVASEKNLSRQCGTGKGTFQSTYRTTQDGGYDMVLEDSKCNEYSHKVTVHVDPSGNLTEIAREDMKVVQGCPVAGRRPDGFVEDASCTCGDDVVGRYFASMAHLEAASVVAFRRLHRQLAEHGAPRELLRRARKAARDEIRHTRATRALAEKFGVAATAPRVESLERAPTLFELALENAREGCVRETYGALVAHVQTRAAEDADVRARMAAIAEEETQHAALSWDIAAWLETKLGEEERSALARERARALAALAEELASPVDATIRATAGVPAPREAQRLLDGLGRFIEAA